MNPPGKSKELFLCNENPWNQDANDIWLGSTLTLYRNLDKFKFPPQLPTDRKQQIISMLTKELIRSKELHAPKSILAEQISSIDKEFLVEHFLSDQGFHQTNTGEAFVVDETGEFLAVINLKDHLLLERIDIKDDLENTLAKLVKVEAALAKSLNFAFSSKFGYLTSDPTRCGTGFVVSVFLHLPLLIHTHRLEEICTKYQEEGIERTGLQGDPNELIGDIVAFHNGFTLGVTEENILTSMRTLAIKLSSEEKSLRNALKQQNDPQAAEVKDKVSRAFAILLHSYQIEAIEALQSLSLLKLGLELGWVKGSSQKELNRLLFACRRAHLMCHYGQKITSEELPHRRAEYIHKTLHGLQLLI